jgi:hypothetical protein
MSTQMPPTRIAWFCSRRQRFDRTFLAERVWNTRMYDPIAGYFSSPLLELVGEDLESVSGPIRCICHQEQRVNAGLEFLKIAGSEFPRSDVRLGC